MSKLYEVIIDSMRVSLMSQHRVVVLKDTVGDRYLSIWIGPCEAESIAYELQEQQAARPLTHDLLKNAIEMMGGTVTSIIISDIKDDIYFAKIMVRKDDGSELTIDARPSDSLALAVRVKVPIFVEEIVMDRASNVEDQEISDEPPANSDTPDDQLSVFKDFLDTLDIDDSGSNEDDRIG